MAKEYQPEWLGRLTLLPVELGNTLLETCKAIEDAADEKFKGEDSERTRAFVTIYLQRVVDTICDWNRDSNSRLVPLSGQPYTFPSWTLIAESLIDRQGTPINENDPKKISGLLDSVCYVPTVLSSDIFIRKSHFRTADTDSYYMALVHRDYIVKNASEACSSCLPPI